MKYFKEVRMKVDSDLINCSNCQHHPQKPDRREYKCVRCANAAWLEDKCYAEFERDEVNDENSR